MADIFDEVNEDLKRDQMQKLWSRFGKYAILAVRLWYWVLVGDRAIQRGRTIRLRLQPLHITMRARGEMI